MIITQNMLKLPRTISSVEVYSKYMFYLLHNAAAL